MGVALFLVLMALAFGNLRRAKIPGVAFLAVFLSIGGLAFSFGSLGTSCTAESNYFCIKVRDREIGDRTVRTLTLDQLVHSYVDLDDPTFFVYSYEKVFAEIATFVGQSRPDMNVLFIGGGGYTMPRFLETIYPQSTLEVIEIDPEVTRVATDYLGLPADTSIVTYNNDARTKIPRLEQGQFDIVMGDAFICDRIRWLKTSSY
jgi:spermidine synthase